MITFGQGLNRAHPNLIKIVDTLEKGDDLKGFTREVSTAHLTYSILYLFQPCHNMTWLDIRVRCMCVKPLHLSWLHTFVSFQIRQAMGFLGHLGANTSRSMTRAFIRPTSKKDLPAYYEGALLCYGTAGQNVHIKLMSGSNQIWLLWPSQLPPHPPLFSSFFNTAQLGRLSSNFALSADLALVLGGRLKYEEMLSGRFADAFGTLYLGYSCLWYYKQLQAQGTHSINFTITHTCRVLKRKMWHNSSHTFRYQSECLV